MKGAGIAGFAEDVLQAVWAAGDHEIGGADEGEEAKLLGQESALRAGGSDSARPSVGYRRAHQGTERRWPGSLKG